jgi:hypothetical protein
MDSQETERFLYRFEYYEPEDNRTYVDWIWLTHEELKDHKSSYNEVKIRLATEDESDLYNEAYADGYGIAAMMEFESQYDGITFRVELGKDGQLDMNGKKMFECAICEKHKDFETEVGTAAGLYLGEVKNDKLWHVCYDCAENAAMLRAIEDSIDDTEEPS